MKKTIIKYLTLIINKLKEEPQNEVNQKSISSLAPKLLTEKEELERIAPYTNRLKDAVNAKGITNIALTGGYGSGKSTILNTFQNLYTDYEYINISLASFKDNKQDNSEENDDLDRQLEISILQQIFYHVKPSTIPDSRFKRIINLTNKSLFLFSLGLVIWILCIILLFKFGYIENLNPATWHISQKIQWGKLFITLFSSIGFFFGIGYLSRILIRLFTNSKINKLNIKGEVELGNEIDKSVFNEHLEEIVYFFQRTSYNVLIIEDLDRFNNTDIFTKLREINILLNKSELIDREINFIYAIRDEMFTDKTERVKFFEYIIPVIPFINPSNAGEQLTKLIKESNLEGVLSTDFTEDVVTFIDDIDMRLLTNIFHEYVLYKDSLQEINQNNLFAIIVYKNISPDDFGKLHKREGHLYKLLSDKSSYIAPIIESNKKKIVEYELEIKSIQNETISNIRELRAIYIHAILKEAPTALAFDIGGNEFSFETILEDDYFQKLKQSDNIQYYIHEAKNQGYYSPYLAKVKSDLAKSFSDIENKVNSDATYEEREQSIISREQGRINQLKEEISEIKNKISVIESWSVTEIFQEIDIDDFIKDTPLNIPLIRNLLINGYINENYNDYISIFHGINMTSQDYSFMRKVKGRIKENFKYPLTNIDQIIKKLPIKYFKSEAILNFDLFDYLSHNYDSYSEQYEAILGLIKKNTENTQKFMDEYIFSERAHVNMFVRELSRSWDGFWKVIYEHPTYTNQKKDKYLFLILCHADINSIYSLNKSLQLAGYIESHEKFISLFEDESHLHKISAIINRLDIYFENLELPNGENSKIFEYIYMNNRYYINVYNITLLLNKLYVGHVETVSSKNYTTILESNCEPLKKYVQEFLPDYLNNVFLKLPDNNNETEDTLLMLLNNESLEDNLKIRILQKQKIKIKDISDIESLSIKYEIVANNKLDATWNNIINYYYQSEEKSINNALIDFLNIEENYHQLNIENFSQKAEDTKEFRENLLIANDLSIQAYTELVIKTPNIWNNLNFSDLNQDKVEWLIENKLALTNSNYDKLRSYFSTISIKLIEKKCDSLMEKYDELELNIEDHIKILQSTIINLSIKEQIIRKIDNEWIAESANLKRLILETLYQSSENLLTFEVLDTIVDYPFNIDKRLHLIYNHIEDLDNDQIQILIEKLGNNYARIFENQKKPTFAYDLLKEEIFKVLENRKMISSYKIDYTKKEIRVVALYK